MSSYNRVVRNVVILLYAALVALVVAACNRGPNQEAVRQGVMDHLAQVGLNVQGMNVDVTSVKFNGNQAEATVAFTPKGGNTSQGMSMRYTLQQQGGKWVVTGRQDSGSPHSGGAMPPGMANPHGGGMPGAQNPHGGGGQMPSPEELPPVKKQ